MQSFKRAVVANTDRAWFDHFRPADDITRVDEVNFWRPSAQQRFGALDVGEPFFLRLKSPVNAIAGFGFFAVQSLLPISIAWQVFEEKNGDPSYDRFVRRISAYRKGAGGSSAGPGDRISCLVLREVVFLPESLWIPWGHEEEWARNIVAYKTFDLSYGPGLRLDGLLQRVPVDPVADFLPEYVPSEVDERVMVSREVAERQGQGTFRTRLLTAYGGRCAITSERSVPALDAAHIQPYQGPASNHIQNGLLLRADLHRLYDAGYLTVTPALEVEVSRRLKEEFENGKIYYALEGKRIAVPERQTSHPSLQALEWHASHVFR